MTVKPVGDVEAVDDAPFERWADISDDPEAICACGDRWEKVAAKIGCTLHGYNDGFCASFLTPDGTVIEVGPKFRAAIAAMGGDAGRLEKLREALDFIERSASSRLTSDIEMMTSVTESTMRYIQETARQALQETTND